MSKIYALGLKSYSSLHSSYSLFVCLKSDMAAESAVRLKAVQRVPSEEVLFVRAMEEASAARLRAVINLLSHLQTFV